MDTAFENWWREFSVRNDRDVHSAAELLRDHVQHMPSADRKEFVVNLARVVCECVGLHGAAAPVLESFATDEARRELLGCLKQLKGGDPVSDGQEATIIRILACSAPEQFRDVVEDYLFIRPVALNHGRVMWTLWPHDPVLFGKAFVRQIRHLSPERLKGTIVFQGFYARPEPLVALKAAFESAGDVALWERTREAIRATEMPGTTGSQRAAVERILERGAAS